MAVYYQIVDCRETGTGLYGFCAECGATINGPHCRPGGYTIPEDQEESKLLCLSCLDELGAERLSEPDPDYEKEVVAALREWRELPD